MKRVVRVTKLKIIISTTTITDKDNNKKLFTIQYSKEELDKITLDFVTQMNKYIARFNDRISQTLEEIEKEAKVEIVSPTAET